MQIMSTTLALAAVLALLFGGPAVPRPEPRHQSPRPPRRHPRPAIPSGSLFATADQCMACHNNLVSPSGRDISIGYEWRSSMMANAARDPYWHAGVRREILDHPEAAEAIQHECSACHMPMMRYEAKANGRLGQVFAHLPISTAAGRPTETVLAADGVSCTVCHQAGKEKLGTKDSFNAGFVVDHTLAPGQRRAFGPVRGRQRARARVMRSASTFSPTEARAHPVVRGVRHLPHPLHARAGAGREGDRRAARTGAVPRVAAQRLREGEELPGVPHAASKPARSPSPRWWASRARRCRATSSAAATSSCRGCSTGTGPSSA